MCVALLLRYSVLVSNMKTSYYAIASPTSGIAISHYPPSGWTGLHYPDLAPSSDLLNGFKRKQYTIEDYNKIYQQQLDKLDPKKVWSDLHALANDAEPTLLCFEKPKVQLSVTGYDPLSSNLNEWFLLTAARYIHINMNQYL